MTLVNETRQAICVQRDVETRSLYNYGRGKARSAKSYGSALAALFTQNAKRMSCLTVPSVAGWRYILFHINPIKNTIFGKVLLNTKCLLISSKTLASKLYVGMTVHL